MVNTIGKLLSPFTILLMILATALSAATIESECREPEAVGAYQPFYQAPVYANSATDTAFVMARVAPVVVNTPLSKEEINLKIYADAIDRIVPSLEAPLDSQHAYYTEFMAILSIAGWDELGQDLKDQAWYVASCESGARLNGECIGPRYWADWGDGGRSVGFFQIQCATWCPYLGITEAQLKEPATNAWAARKIIEYDRERGHEDWNQWTVKPW